LATSYSQPDDLWIANWNGRANAQQLVPARERLVRPPGSQYRGGHDETYGA